MKNYKKRIMYPLVLIFSNRIGEHILNFLLNIIYYLLGYGSGDSVNFSGEKYVISQLEKNTKHRTATILDVGSNIGQFASLVSDLFHKENFNIYCFEPMEQSYKVLSDKFNNKKNFKLFNYGLGKLNEKRKIYFDNPISGSASLVEHSHHFDIDKASQKTIDLDSIDNFVNINNIKKIDLLKIDVEGFEFEVLNGARQAISNRRIDSILFEFGGNGIGQRVFLFDIFTFFQKNNFTLFRVTPSGYLSEIKKYNSTLEKLVCTNYFAQLRKT